MTKKIKNEINVSLPVIFNSFAIAGDEFGAGSEMGLLLGYTEANTGRLTFFVSNPIGKNEIHDSLKPLIEGSTSITPLGFMDYQNFVAMSRMRPKCDISADNTFEGLSEPLADIVFGGSIDTGLIAVTAKQVQIKDPAPKTNNEVLVEKTVNRIFKSAQLRDYEDGDLSEFGEEIRKYLEVNGSLAINVIDNWAESQPYPEELIAEMYKQMGSIQDPKLTALISYALKIALKEGSPIIKNGAIAGVVSLGDKKNITVLEERHKEEENRFIRISLARAIEALKKI